MTAITLSGNNTIFNRLSAKATVTIQLNNQPNIFIPASGDIYVTASHWESTNVAGGVDPGNWTVQISFQLRKGWRAIVRDGPVVDVEDHNHDFVQTLTLVRV